MHAIKVKEGMHLLPPPRLLKGSASRPYMGPEAPWTHWKTCALRALWDSFHKCLMIDG